MGRVSASQLLVSVVNTTRYDETQQWTHTAATHSSEIYLKTQTTAHETTSLFFFSSFVSKRRQQMFSSKQKTLLSLLWSSFTQDTTPLFRHSTNAQSRDRERSGDSFSCPCGRHPEIYLSHRKKKYICLCQQIIIVMMLWCWWWWWWWWWWRRLIAGRQPGKEQSQRAWIYTQARKPWLSRF